MQRLTANILILVAIILAGAGLLAAQEGDEGDSEPVVTIREQTYEYAGSRECRDCHRDQTRAHADTPHALTLVELEDDMEPEEYPVVGDFSIGDDLRTVTFPDGETRPFTVEDVAYTLGAGLNAQAYVFADDEAFFVFPAQWDVNASAWTALELGDEWLSDGYNFLETCAGCHAQERRPARNSWSEDGVMCETCHGPGLDHVEAADDAGRDIDEAERIEIYALINLGLDAETCGTCHARGLSTDGVHPFATDYYPGQDLSAAFDLVDPSDGNFFYSTGHALESYMQYNEGLTSAHANALEGLQSNVEDYPAECLTCHSVAHQRLEMLLANEEIDPATVTVERVLSEVPHGVTCSSCHASHLSVDEEAGETRPASGLRMEGDQLCVSCHMDTDVTEGLHHPTMEVYQGLPLIEQVEAVPGAHFTAEGGPTCTSCHMAAVDTPNGVRHSHTFNIVSPGEALDIEMLQDSCSGCHEEHPEALQELIDDIQVDVQARIDTAREAVDDDTPSWVVTALDALEGDGSAGMHNYAYTDSLLDAVEVELNLLIDEEA